MMTLSQPFFSAWVGHLGILAGPLVGSIGRGRRIGVAMARILIRRV